MTIDRPGCVVARCEGCGLGFEADGLRLSAGELVGECSDCGCPLYVVGLADLVEVIEGCAACVAGGVECEFHRGFAAGWDACAALVACRAEAGREAELAAWDVLAGEGL